jgi:hypothetical protein
MRRIGWWTWLGAVTIAASLASSAVGVGIVGRYLTPLCWTGFILLIDGLLDRRGESLLRGRPRELALMALLSVPSWLLFELYNRPRFWRAGGPELWWHYHGLPPWPERGLGYAWSFATITPAVLLLARWLEPALARAVGRGAGGRVPGELAFGVASVGATLAALPLLWPSPYFAADVWLAWPLLLDPVNWRLGRPSLLGDLEQGRRARPIALLVAGLGCGLLWEAWNMAATSRWTYTVPFLGDLKAFEMPLLGFLGFAPFALAVFAVYQFLRRLLPGRPVEWSATPSSPSAAA